MKNDGLSKAMSVKELAQEMGLAVFTLREAIKEGKFEYFAWAFGTDKKRCNIYINRERYKLWIKGHDLELIKKALAEWSDSTSAKEKQ